MENLQQEEDKKYLRNRTKGVNYVKGKMLGSGGFAKCYEAISAEDGKIYAAKVIPKKSINEKRQRYKLLIEIKLHRSLDHVYIVGFKDAFEDRENVYILLEYCRNYTLKQLVKRRKRLTEHEARIYTMQIIKALQYIHSKSIIHRDLKLGNILISEKMEIKICDFGLSTRVKKEGDLKKTICGTPNYIAPEILQENGHSYEVDIWSIGVILYTLLYGKPPFEDNTVQQTYQNIKSNRFSFPSAVVTSQAAKDVISKILVMNPVKRLTLQEILDHQFMQIPIGMGNTLSCATLAVPPLNNQIQPINLNDVAIEHSQSVSMQNFQRDNMGYDELDLLLSKKKAKQFKYLYIREIFEHEGTCGFLLSNGIIGAFEQKTGKNIILEFGSQHYSTYEMGKQPKKHLMPDQNELTSSLRSLVYFRSYFLTKYSIFKLDQMKKRQLSQEPVYIKKCSSVGKNLITRLSNSVIQLHFPDITTIMINHEESQGIFYVDQRGKFSEIDYNTCQSNRVKTKVRKFSRILEIISKNQAGQSQMIEN